MSNIIQYPSKRKKSLAAQFTVKDDSNIVEHASEVRLFVA